MYSIVLAAALSSLILVGGTNIYAQNEKFRAKLDGNNEVPAVKTTAEGVINFKTNNDTMTWKMNITGITDATGAHIHNGKTGQNGDVIVDLLTSSKHSNTPTGMILRGNITDSSLTGPMKGKTLADLRSAMTSGDAYVNVHTKDHPNGMIRGQINFKGGNETSTATLNMTNTTSTQ